MAANDRTTREERLAAKLRENLRRRKAQAKGQAEIRNGAGAKPTGCAPETLSKNDSQR